MTDFKLTDKQIEQFNQDGYFVAEEFFDSEELDLLRQIARADHQLA